MEKIKILNIWKCKDSNNYKCPHCSKEYSFRGIATHIWRMHRNGRNHNPNNGYKKDRKIWNKGLTKQNDIRILKYSLEISKSHKEKIKNGTYKLTGFANPTDEFRKKQSERMSKNNVGGKCKWYEVDGKKVQGGWEKDIALKLNQFKIHWSRCKPIIYHKNNKEKRYTPDFYLPKFDLFLEIKGYWWRIRNT